MKRIVQLIVTASSTGMATEEYRRAPVRRLPAARNPLGVGERRINTTPSDPTRRSTGGASKVSAATQTRLVSSFETVL